MSDDDLDPFAPGAMSFTPASKLTGEVFYMAPCDNPIHKRGWEKLHDTIRNLGGDVKVLDTPIMGNQQRNSHFTRDIGITLPTSKGNYFLYSDPDSEGIGPDLANEISIAMRHPTHFLGMHKRKIDGLVEGGNAVYDAHRHILFVGVNNYKFGHAMENMQHMVELPKEEQIAAYRQERLRYKAPETKGFYSLLEQVADINSNLPKSEQIQVVPLHIPDEKAFPPSAGGKNFYHLDNLLGILPSGQALVCESAFAKPSLMRLQKILGRGNMVSVSEDAASHGVTNFITVGKTVITPYSQSTAGRAQPDFKAQFAQWGYDVVDPEAAGLASHAWRFAAGGFVRCATQKITPDMGFPEPAIAKGRSAAGG
jgi:N-dimethylarginine dimethylaminohydrolase